MLIPNLLENANSFKCLVINKRDGNCNSFKDKGQVDFYNKCICLDPIYNVLWSYDSDSHRVCLYNIVASEFAVRGIEDFDVQAGIRFTERDLTSILSPELALPVVSSCHVTRLQAAIHLLCCLDTLTLAQNLDVVAVKEEVDGRHVGLGKQYSREDFQVANRFESHGGGWGYSGHSVEAIRFMCDSDVLLGENFAWAS